MRHGFGLDIPENLADVCDPARMALVIYDMQAGIVGQLPDGPEIVARVGRLLGAARRGGYRVFFTRHMSLPGQPVRRDATAHRHGLAAGGERR